MALYKLSGAKRKVGRPYQYNAFHLFERQRRSTVVRIPVLMAGASLSASDPYAQQRGAFRILVQNNIHGIANQLYSLLQKNPALVTAPWIAMGGEPNTIMHDIAQGNAKPAIDAGTAATLMLNGNTGAAKIGAKGSWPPTLSTFTWYAVNMGTLLINVPGQLGNNDLFLNQLYSSIMAGQDGNGYYGWWDANGNFWSGSDADAEMRTAYGQTSQWWQGPSNVAMNSAAGPTLASTGGPKAKGADINAAAAASGSGCTGSQVAATAANIANTILPGVGNIIQAASNAVSGATGSGCSVVDTSPTLPPPAPPIIAVSYTTPLLIGGGLLLLIGFGAWALSD